MSFTAANNVITVKNVDNEIIFDTGTPMPHITNTITNSIIHAFPESGDTKSVSWGITSSFGMCTELDYQCWWERQCNWETVCQSVYRCSYQTVCGYVWTSSGYVYTCNQKYVCNWVNECTQKYVCRDVQVCDWVSVDAPVYYTAANYIIDALENESVYTIGTVNENINPDFILVLASAVRTIAGSDIDYGTFVSVIPQGEMIAANGSTILETAFREDGQPWLSRIMSVYIDGNTIRASFKHSNSAYTSINDFLVYECVVVEPPDKPSSTSSTWTVNFTVYVGKFTLQT